jgi:hypothetical protein
MASVWTAVIGGVSGLASGALVSFGTPWVKWCIEQRRIDRQRRYDLLDSWRAGISRLEGDAHEALDTPWCESLRPYLADDVRRRLERPRTIHISPDSGRGAKDFFSGEVDLIEREWGLRQ